MRCKQILCMLFLLVAPSIRGADAVPEVAPPKSWSHFTILPWQFQTDVVHDRALYGVH